MAAGDSLVFILFQNPILAQVGRYLFSAQIEIVSFFQHFGQKALN